MHISTTNTVYVNQLNNITWLYNQFI